MQYYTVVETVNVRDTARLHGNAQLLNYAILSGSRNYFHCMFLI